MSTPELEKEEGSAAPAESKDDESRKQPLRREPSFSRWCDEDRIDLASRSGSRDSSSSAADESDDFELPLLQDASRSGPSDGQRSSYFRQRSSTVDGRRYATFNVENGLHPSNSCAKLESLEQSAQVTISWVVVLKTLFYIVVWYTFSTCLTLYNKSLLGDKLGKFPAPLLMNTFHFTLQAVLSKAIMCFQSQGLESGVSMTWRDYFIRDGLYLWQLYRQLLGLPWI